MLDYLRKEQFIEKIRDVSTRALASGALQKISTLQSETEENGRRYIVRVVDSLQRKSTQMTQRIEQKPIEYNPFLPYEPALYIGELSQTHRCLLNKFQVVDEHILLVTNEFRDQREVLDLDDFLAAAVAMEAKQSLLFYNGGKKAGASVQHKHLQAIPLTQDVSLPLLDLLRVVAEDIEPLYPVLPDTLPFKIAVCRLPLEGNTERFAEQSHAAYCEMLDLLKIKRDNNGWLAPYNLLMTTDLLWLVPRRQEAYGGFGVNALGYAGTLLVKSAEELAQLNELGAETLLRQVGCPV